MNIYNKSGEDISDVEKLLPDFLNFCQNRLKLSKSFNIVFVSDYNNSKNPLGKTAYYDPSTYNIYCYVDNRHCKDMLRSISHELIHHEQNCKGEFSELDNTQPGYAQEDPHLRKMEEEAYLNGNMMFRDWEDQYKSNIVEKTIKQKSQRLFESLIKNLKRG